MAGGYSVRLGWKPERYDQQQLLMGMQVELEHTPSAGKTLDDARPEDIVAAATTTMDHLAEQVLAGHPQDYYTTLTTCVEGDGAVRLDMGEMQGNAKWSTSYVNSLPDSAFLYIGPGGEQHEDGRTRPLGLRKLPYRNAQGQVDLHHLRNAISRLPMTDIPQTLKASIKRRACQLLQKSGGECSSMAANARTQCWKLDVTDSYTGPRYLIRDSSTGVPIFYQMFDDEDGAESWVDAENGYDIEGALLAEIKAFVGCSGGHPHIVDEGVRWADLPRRRGARQEMEANRKLGLKDVAEAWGIDPKFLAVVEDNLGAYPWSVYETASMGRLPSEVVLGHQEPIGEGATREAALVDAIENSPAAALGEPREDEEGLWGPED